MPEPSQEAPGKGAASSQPPQADDKRPEPPPIYASKVYPEWQSHDPRSSSSLSLAQAAADDDPRRTLLMIYIHGFMGNDSSFRSFPAHVHSFLEQTLAESHVVHTKIYPRYKTYKAIDVARDNFSKWLEPHESPTTDVVLVGHSMGGLLAADIVLMQTPNADSIRHRILGTISLDSPFLGLHPGIIVSGIASIFRPAPSPLADAPPPDSPASSRNTMESLSRDPSILSEPSSEQLSSLRLSASSQQPEPFSSDSSFNPPFFNDVMFRDRGWVKNIVHFANKHKSENLVEAARNHILSHLEFGGCLADYPALNSRYRKLRQLEDVNEFAAARVRFANYYTLSSGREKKPKPKEEQEQQQEQKQEQEQDPEPGPEPESSGLKPELVTQSPKINSQDIDEHTSTPRISIEDHSDDEVLRVIEPMPEEDEFDDPEEDEPPPPAYNTETVETPSPAPDGASSDGPPDNLKLPAIPEPPEPPVAPDLDQYADKAVQKQVEKEAKRAQKTYEQAVKLRDKAVRERQKLIEKYERKTLKETAKRDKEREKDTRKREKDAQKKLADEERAWRKEQQQQQQQQQQQPQEAGTVKQKDRKFCMLPREVSAGRDPAWVQVRMVGMDEVGAHCGVFLPGPHYEGLVGDVGSRVVGWVREDASRRAVLGLEETGVLVTDDGVEEDDWNE